MIGARVLARHGVSRYGSDPGATHRRLSRCAISKGIFRRIDPIADTQFRLRSPLLLDLPRAESVRARMRQIELLVETYLAAERELVAASDAAGGAIPLPHGRTVPTGTAHVH